MRVEGGRCCTCSVDDEQPRSEKSRETSRPHKPDISQAWNDIHNKRRQTRSLEAEDDADVVGGERNADDGKKKCDGASNLRASERYIFSIIFVVHSARALGLNVAKHRSVKMGWHGGGFVPSETWANHRLQRERKGAKSCCGSREKAGETMR